MSESDDVTRPKSDSERISRLEAACAEIVDWCKGNYHPTAESAAAEILHERQDDERAAAEREAAVRAEVQARADAEVEARLEREGVSA